ncbi:MAG: hypothetical protein L3K15_07230, partial [Thermoplasmata archaeon]|nr:hypothetical protein [Thermoplasmata archaeon]
LRSAIPHADVATASVPDGGPYPWDPEMLPVLTSATPGLEPPVEVLLPPTSGGRYREYLIGIPRTQRFVRLWDPKGAGASPEFGPDAESVALPGFRRERLPVGALAALFILSATIEPSWRQRELAMLAANATPARVRIFRRVAPRAPRPPRGVGPLMLRLGRIRGQGGR